MIHFLLGHYSAVYAAVRIDSDEPKLVTKDVKIVAFCDVDGGATRGVAMVLNHLGDLVLAMDLPNTQDFGEWEFVGVCVWGRGDVPNVCLSGLTESESRERWQRVKKKLTDAALARQQIEQQKGGES